ncbi:hypothetical protein HJ588_17385 [Flexivirga sp. ID2601S]|uniref:PRC-barrel domain containing protein n=1 Tax=Flexivirga aerilata TaxID=1656889 RepID=A0A849AJM2_9MICO|nr:hypothetical protein [Flexivirga aerilata]NNG41034.1 hypothetical protein [Flexivirga aerilata]
MTEWEWEASAASQLLDVQIYSASGEPVGKVDDLEFSTTERNEAPVLTAFLCGPTAFGPRIGGLLGLGVWAAARRLSPTGASPVRIPLSEVKRINRREIRLRESAQVLGIHRGTEWTREHVIRPLSGGSR